MATNPKQTTRPMHGPGPRGMVAAKPKHFKQTMIKIAKYLWPHKMALSVVMISAILSTVFLVIGPRILSRAIDVLLNGLMAKVRNDGAIDFNQIGYWLLIMLGLYILSSAAMLVQGLVMTQVTQKVVYNLRKEMSQKINRMAMSYFEEQPFGEVLSRITNDMDTFTQALNNSVAQAVSSVVQIVGIVIMMLTISPLMTGITLIILPLSVVILGTIMKFSQKHFKAQQKGLGQINGQVEEVYAGQQIVKAFNQEANQEVIFQSANDQLYHAAWKSQFFSGLMMPLMSFIANLGYVAVVILGSVLAMNGSITVGSIQAFIQYMRNFTQPIRQLAQISNMLQSMAAGAERVFEFLEEPNEADEGTRQFDPTQAKGAVTFDQVSFGYQPNEPIIKSFNVQVEPGQKIAIVGPTGAGKTTIVKLLLRFYDVDEGRILIDGVDSRSFQRTELRQYFGMVMQDTWLFNGTIMENLRYGNLNATDEQVIQAAKSARVDHFIRTLPEGYQTVMNENSDNISQGQKQLLTIARAILADMPILILDEATSSVDTRTELLIQEAMDQLMGNRTSFVIAHRLSTIKNADRILVMDQGNIIEQGTHEELIEQGGFYYDLYNSQFETIEEAD
ncbi:ABC transporter ATP-binding protein [Atopobacter phocae]|uniref:ABC transporter ATP-binding protein n=1 Tax=Atopobacter phocae TaxID=136492 RepID=UPI0004725DD5|nr:ABC transporter ATP-binding protein [Atopobacter phocae]